MLVGEKTGSLKKSKLKLKQIPACFYLLPLKLGYILCQAFSFSWNAFANSLLPDKSLYAQFVLNTKVWNAFAQCLAKVRSLNTENSLNAVFRQILLLLLFLCAVAKAVMLKKII